MRGRGWLWLWLLWAAPVQAATFSDTEWRRIYQQVGAVYGAPARQRIEAWRGLMALPQAGVADRSKLETVNHFFNRLQFVEDAELWGQRDYWATPLEFLGARGGDCEDFSIAKYLTLLALGVAQEKLRISYVKATRLEQFHMVVAYYAEPDRVPLILDNLEAEIRPATERTDLVPIYSFNGQHLWLNREKGQGRLTGRADRIARWQDLRSRYRIQRLRRPERQLD